MNNGALVTDIAPVGNKRICVLICRVCGKMEPGDARVGDAVSSLSALLRHSDARVADAALRCFASLADRFARAHADPAPLAEHGMNILWSMKFLQKTNMYHLYVV